MIITMNTIDQWMSIFQNCIGNKFHFFFQVLKFMSRFYNIMHQVYQYPFFLPLCIFCMIIQAVNHMFSSLYITTYKISDMDVSLKPYTLWVFKSDRENISSQGVVLSSLPNFRDT